MFPGGEVLAEGLVSCCWCGFGVVAVIEPSASAREREMERERERWREGERRRRGKLGASLITQAANQQSRAESRKLCWVRGS